MKGVAKVPDALLVAVARRAHRVRRGAAHAHCVLCRRPRDGGQRRHHRRHRLLRRGVNRVRARPHLVRVVRAARHVHVADVPARRREGRLRLQRAQRRVRRGEHLVRRRDGRHDGRRAAADELQVLRLDGRHKELRRVAGRQRARVEEARRDLHLQRVDARDTRCGAGLRRNVLVDCEKEGQPNRAGGPRVERRLSVDDLAVRARRRPEREPRRV